MKLQPKEDKLVYRKKQFFVTYFKMLNKNILQLTNLINYLYYLNHYSNDKKPI